MWCGNQLKNANGIALLFVVHLSALDVIFLLLARLGGFLVIGPLEAFGEKADYSNFDRCSWEQRANMQHRENAIKQLQSSTLAERKKAYLPTIPGFPGFYRKSRSYPGVPEKYPFSRITATHHCACPARSTQTRARRTLSFQDHNLSSGNETTCKTAIETSSSGSLVEREHPYVQVLLVVAIIVITATSCSKEEETR